MSTLTVEEQETILNLNAELSDKPRSVLED
jgi:hypothetical protein